MIRLDDRDLKILTVLQSDGRITKSALAEKVHLSPTACWERLKRLEDAGVIESYAARIDPRLLAGATEVIVSIELDSHRAEDFEAFETAIETVPEITECYAVGGGFDYMMKVCAPDVAAYQSLIDGLLDRAIGIKRYYTYIVTKGIKRAPVPVGRLIGT